MHNSNTRLEFLEMLYKCCPECKSIETFETKASVNSNDYEDVAICDDCGHTEKKE